MYRKEYVEPEMKKDDLWKVYEWDEKVSLNYWKIFIGKNKSRLTVIHFCTTYVLLCDLLHLLMFSSNVMMEINIVILFCIQIVLVCLLYM